jgi:hypothetical protein
MLRVQDQSQYREGGGFAIQWRLGFILLYRRFHRSLDLNGTQGFRKFRDRFGNGWAGLPGLLGLPGGAQQGSQGREGVQGSARRRLTIGCISLGAVRRRLIMASAGFPFGKVDGDRTRFQRHLRGFRLRPFIEFQGGFGAFRNRPVGGFEGDGLFRAREG